MIHMAKRTTVSTIVFSPSPNNTMMTGTSALSGADRNMLTQGSSMRSARTDLPIKMPRGTPIATAIALPRRKLLPVINRAFMKLGVGTISTSKPIRPSRPAMKSRAPVMPALKEGSAETLG